MKRMAGQLVEAVGCVHSVGIVQGGLCEVCAMQVFYIILVFTLNISPRNVLLRLTGTDSWSLGYNFPQPRHSREEEVFSAKGKAPGIHAPKYLVQPTSFSKVGEEYSSEDIVLIDLGEAFLLSSSPPKGVGTPKKKSASPELLTEK